VVDDARRRRQPRGQGGRVGQVRPAQVGDHAAVRARRRVGAHRHRAEGAERAQRRRQAEREQLERHGRRERIDGLRAVGDDDEPRGCRGDELLPGVRTAAALDQPPVRRDLVGAVDRQVEAVERREVLDGQPQLVRLPLGRDARGDAAHAAHPADGQRRQEVGDGRAGAQAEAHPVLDELGRGLGGGALVGVGAHPVFVPPQPVGELPGRPGQAVAGVPEPLAEALGVVGDRVGRGLARRRHRVRPPGVLAGDDPVELAGADPVHDLAHALDRQGMGRAEVGQQPLELVQPLAALAVLARLAQVRVEVEVLRRGAGAQAHVQAADRQRVAGDERGGAVARQLGGAEPLEQREAHRGQRQPGGERQPGQGDPHEDLERRPVQHVVGEDVRDLVGEHDAQVVVLGAQVHHRRVQDDDRLARADRHRVGERALGHVELVLLGHVEGHEHLAVDLPHLGELVGPEADRRAEVELAQRALVAELDELAHDGVEHRHRREGGGRRPVGRVLVRERRDVLQLVALDGQAAHGSRP
jgi:hypothetical protein